MSKIREAQDIALRSLQAPPPIIASSEAKELAARRHLLNDVLPSLACRRSEFQRQVPSTHKDIGLRGQGGPLTSKLWSSTELVEKILVPGSLKKGFFNSKACNTVHIPQKGNHRQIVAAK